MQRKTKVTAVYVFGICCTHVVLWLMWWNSEKDDIRINEPNGQNTMTPNKAIVNEKMEWLTINKSRDKF